MVRTRRARNRFALRSPRMLACLRTAAVFGVDASPVDVEVDVSFGLDHLHDAIHARLNN